MEAMSLEVKRKEPSFFKSLASLVSSDLIGRKALLNQGNETRSSQLSQTERSLGSLTRDEENGWILEDSTRIVSFRVKTFQAFVDKLVSMAGRRVAEILLYNMGNEMGRTICHYSKDDIKSENDLGEVLDRVARLRGWGRCLVFEKRKESSRTLYLVKFRGTPLSYERTSMEPTCHVVRGGIVGYLEAYLSKKAAASSEIECASLGHEFCVFEVTFAD